MATANSTQPMMPAKTRPTGVTILGVLSVLIGIGLFILGIIGILVTIGFGFASLFTGFTGSALTAFGWTLIFLIFGLLTLATGVGLLRLHTWGLALGLITYIVIAGIQFIPLAYGHTMTWFNWGTFAFYLFLFLYLLAVRKHFQ